MKVKLLDYTKLEVADIAISKCYNKEPYKDLEKQQARINRVANVSKHSSTIEHLVYVFDIDGISRAVLQEKSRHRIASPTVKSTRYTLKELLNDFGKVEEFLVKTGNETIDKLNQEHMIKVAKAMKDENIPNDIAKYAIVEAYKTSLVFTINARSLQNFLALRTDKHALWEIQDLARAMYEVIPEEHKFLFKDKVNEKDK